MDSFFFRDYSVLPASLSTTSDMFLSTQAQPQPQKLLDQVRQALHLKHYSYRTEQTYVDWIKRFIPCHKRRHLAGMGANEIEAFLTHLAVNEKVSAST